MFVEYEDELRADFQQFYGICWDHCERLYPLEHVATLCEQLPIESRVARAINPENAWDNNTRLLALIEYWVHCNVWAKSKDAKYKQNKPQLHQPKTAKPQEIYEAVEREELKRIFNH